MGAPPVSSSIPTPLQKIQTPSLASACPAHHTRPHILPSPLLASPSASPAPRRDPNPKTRSSRGGRCHSQFPNISPDYLANLAPPPSFSSSRLCHPLFLFFEIFWCSFWLFLSGARALGGLAAAGAWNRHFSLACLRFL